MNDTLAPFRQVQFHISLILLLQQMLLNFGRCSMIPQSSVTPRIVRTLSPSAKKIFFLRDDLLQLSNPRLHRLPQDEAEQVPEQANDFISGNKIRKFYSLYKKLEGDSSQFPRLIQSYGGAQSNAMLALARISSWGSARFVYYTNKLPTFLSNAPNGNLKRALECGMQLVELDSVAYQDVVRDQAMSTHCLAYNNNANQGDTMWVKQGGSLEEARIGAQSLASDILSFCQSQTAKGPRRCQWKVIFASGTGVTALATAEELRLLRSSQHNICDNNNNNDIENDNEDEDEDGLDKMDIEIVAMPCLGTAESLRIDLSKISNIPIKNLPLTVLESPPNSPKPRHFAKPCKEHFDIWKSIISDTGIENFDLVYTPRAFELLFDKESWWDDDAVNILYYCCGGSEGNDSMLARYKYLGI